MMQLTANGRYIHPQLFPNTVQDQFLSIIGKSLSDYTNIYKMLCLTGCPEVKIQYHTFKKENTVSRSLLIQGQFQNTTQVTFIWQQGFCLKAKCHGMAPCPMAIIIQCPDPRPSLWKNCLFCHFKTTCKKHFTSILPLILQFKDFHQENIKHSQHALRGQASCH